MNCRGRGQIEKEFKALGFPSGAQPQSLANDCSHGFGTEASLLLPGSNNRVRQLRDFPDKCAGALFMYEHQQAFDDDGFGGLTQLHFRRLIMVLECRNYRLLPPFLALETRAEDTSESPGLMTEARCIETRRCYLSVHAEPILQQSLLDVPQFQNLWL
jgi:hypothetical protein